MYETLVEQAKRDAKRNGWTFVDYEIKEDHIIVTFSEKGRQFTERYS